MTGSQVQSAFSLQWQEYKLRHNATLNILFLPKYCSKRMKRWQGLLISKITKPPTIRATNLETESQIGGLKENYLVFILKPIHVWGWMGKERRQLIYQIPLKFLLESYKA